MRNSITFAGRLGKDPELRYSANGVAWATMRVAVDIFGPKKGEERERKTIWVTVKAFRWLAEHAAESLRKGAPVVVTGSVDDLRVWTDNQGSAHPEITVIADTIGIDLYRGTSNWTKPEPNTRSAVQAAGEQAIVDDLGGFEVGAGVNTGPGDAPF